MMNFRKAGWSMTLAFAVLCAFAFVQADKTMLRLALKKGKTYDYNTNVDMVMDMMGQTIPMKMSTGYRMTVTEARKDEHVIKFSYKNFMMDMPMVPGMSFNTETPDASNPLSEQMSKIVGSEFTMVLGADGKVKEVKGLQELAEKTGSDNPTASQLLSEDNLKQIMEQSFNFLPNKLVGVGETWQKDQAVSGSQLPVKMLTTYKVKSITANRILLDVSSLMKPDKSAPATPGLEGVEMSGDMKGTMELDKETCFPLNSNIVINMKGDKDGAEMFKMKMTSVNTGKVN